MMPLWLKLLLSWAFIALGICFLGMYAVGNRQAQEVLQAAFTGWAMLLVPGGLYFVWRKN